MSYAQPQSSSRRLTALVAVGIFHVLLVYALVHGLARKIVEVVRAPLETKIIEEVKRPPPEHPPPGVPAPVRTPAVVDSRGCPKPAYPAASIRANETGLVTLTFLIDVDGRVLESKVERSSGHRRLDEAARAGLGICKFTPATVDGRPERAWARIQYDWKLE